MSEVIMVKNVSAMAVRKNLGDLLNSVQYQHNSIRITKAGKPVAALIDIELFDKIHRMKDQFVRLSEELAHAYQNDPSEQIESEIADALKSVRQKK